MHRDGESEGVAAGGKKKKKWCAVNVHAKHDCGVGSAQSCPSYDSQWRGVVGT